MILYTQSIKHFGYLQTVVCCYTIMQTFRNGEPHRFVLLPHPDLLGMFRLMQKVLFYLSRDVDAWSPVHHIHWLHLFFAYGFDLAFAGLHNFFRNWKHLVICRMLAQMIAGNPSGCSLAGCMFRLMLGTNFKILFFNRVSLHTG